MNIDEMSGNDLILAMLEGKIPQPPIMDTVPMRITEVSKGIVKFIVKADHRHLNPMGGVHGGFAATVLDSVTGCAVHTMLDAGVGYGTVDLSLKMLRPIPVGVDLYAEGKLINISKSLGVSEGAIKGADGKLYSHATCTCILQRPQSA